MAHSININLQKETKNASSKLVFYTIIALNPNQAITYNTLENIPSSERKVQSLILVYTYVT